MLTLRHLVNAMAKYHSPLSRTYPLALAFHFSEDHYIGDQHISSQLPERPRDHSDSMMTVPVYQISLPTVVWIITNLFIAPTSGFNYSQCAGDANTTYWRAPNDTFLRDQLGRPTNNSSKAWGISYQSCLEVCGDSYSAQYYDWNSLSQGLTSWLLPWLALTAQLPFATNDTQTNFMVLLLALGSPLLITFSLALTILNSRSINKRFRQIKRDITFLNSPQLTNDIQWSTEGIRSACCTSRKLDLVAKSSRGDSKDEKGMDILIIRSSRLGLCHADTGPRRFLYYCILQHKHWNWPCHQQPLDLDDSHRPWLGLCRHADLCRVHRGGDNSYQDTSPW